MKPSATSRPLTPLPKRFARPAAAIRGAAAPNPYAQMAELPYPPAYQFGGPQDGAAPPGLKVPPAGVQQLAPNGGAPGGGASLV